ncbi:MAG: ATP-binding cassette domain-containing protein [Pseudomonadota bacterium]
MQPAIEIAGVTKRFGKNVAVNALDLSIPAGEIYGFLGPNGAGKTTTIRMIMSILYPDEGDLHVLGHRDTEAVKDRLGYLPEEKGLYKKMTAGEILVYFGRLKGLPRGEAKRRAKDLLERYGLGDRHDVRCEALSKGMGQKVQILGTIIHEPELVILDEPFSGLDPVNIELMRDLILDLKRRGMTVIFSTHIMQQAEQLCDRIFLINRGQKVLDGTLEEIKGGFESGIHLDYDGNGARIREIDGIDRINDSGKQAELYLDPETDPQAVLRALTERVTIRRFDVRAPSLHEIFVQSVGGQVDE